MDDTGVEPRSVNFVFCCGSRPIPTGGSEVVLCWPGTFNTHPETAAHAETRKRCRPTWSDGQEEEVASAFIVRSAVGAMDEKPSPQSAREAGDLCSGDEASAKHSPTEFTSDECFTSGSAASAHAQDLGGAQEKKQCQQQQQQQQKCGDASAGEAGFDNHGIRTAGMQQHQQQCRRPVRVVIHEAPSEDLGSFTWPSAVVLACLVWARRDEFRGASVVEIGAGTALPGLLAAKLGAHVTLTDREGDPWVINNIRGAATANGLPQVCPLSEGVDTTHSSEGREVIYERKRWPEDLGDGAAARDRSSTGSCCVHELSWGNVAPAAIDLATAHPRPQFILGADVFYSSEHFDSVLATVYMFLAAAAAGTTTAFPRAQENRNRLTGRRSGASFKGDACAAVDVAGSDGLAESGEGAKLRAITKSGRVERIGCDARSGASGGPIAPRRSVFLTAYHERSARRSLRPLLRKWGMVARVLPDGPRHVLPDDLWEDGRYGSVALIEISLRGSEETRR